MAIVLRCCKCGKTMTEMYGFIRLKSGGVVEVTCEQCLREEVDVPPVS
jgi:hypothetical protein